jgi:hypothetical protein
MAKATGKGNWSYSGIPGLNVGESSMMKAIKKKYPGLNKGNGKVTTPGFKPGQPYQKDKNVSKLYKTY